MKNDNDSKSRRRQDSFYEESDFYESGFPEKPLYESHEQESAPSRLHAIDRRRKDKGALSNPRRDLAAVYSIVRAVILALLVVAVFFMLRKGVALYEGEQELEGHRLQAMSPVLAEVQLVKDVDIGQESDIQAFFERQVNDWTEADRLVRAAQGHVRRNNPDQAIERCHDALRSSPANMDVLELLATLYEQKDMHVEAINAYIRLLSLDSSRKELQVSLINTLYRYGDFSSVIYVAGWYLEESGYDADVQFRLAEALFHDQQLIEALNAFERVLKDSPKNAQALISQIDIHMRLNRFAAALPLFDQLYDQLYRHPWFYKRLAICNAQAGRAAQAVQTLGKATSLLGRDRVMEWLKDPQLAVVHEEKIFQPFVRRLESEALAQSTYNVEPEADHLPKSLFSSDDTLDIKPPELLEGPAAGRERDDEL